jgi:hypothetical protein
MAGWWGRLTWLIHSGLGVSRNDPEWRLYGAPTVGGRVSVHDGHSLSLCCRNNFQVFFLCHISITPIYLCNACVDYREVDHFSKCLTGRLHRLLHYGMHQCNISGYGVMPQSSSMSIVEKIIPLFIYFENGASQSNNELRSHSRMRVNLE